MKKNNTTEEKIKEQRENRKSPVATAAGVIMAAGMNILIHNSANAQEPDVKYSTSNNTEQVFNNQQNYNYLFSNAEKLFDMYCLAYNKNNFGNMVSETEKTKCQEFFAKHPKLKGKCEEANNYLNENRGLQGLNNAVLEANRQGNTSLRASILGALAKDTKAVEEMNKIKLNSSYAENVTAEEKLAAQIWIMYVKVETDNAPKSYKEFFDKHPEITKTCGTAASKVGLTKETLSTSTIADINAEMMLNNQTLGPGNSRNLTDELIREANNYKEVTGETLEIPSSTYKLTTSDLMQMHQSRNR